MKEFEVIRLPATEEMTRSANKAVLRVLPFTSKLLNGRRYLVTQAYLSVETNSRTPQKGVGLIFDPENGREYSLAIPNFNRFMDTGDPSLLPKEATSPMKPGALQLRERGSPAGG